MQDFFEGLASLLNVKADEALSELFDEEGNLKEGAKPLDVFGPLVKTRLDNVYKAAERKTSDRFQSWVKSQGFESDLQGTDLLQAYFESVKSKPSNGNQNASEWEKKYNDLFPKVEAFESQIAQLKDDHAKELRQKDVAVVQSRLRGDIVRTLGNKWAGNDQHLNILLHSFPVDRIKYEGDTAKLLNESGEVLVDEYHRPVAFEDRVKELGSLIGGFHKVDPGKGAPPPPTGQGGSGQKFSLPAGISQREFNQLLDNTKDPVKRKEIIEARKLQLEQK